MGLLRTPAINCYAINCCPINCYHFCITAVLALLDALSILYGAGLLCSSPSLCCFSQQNAFITGCGCDDHDTHRGHPERGLPS